jgi:hypothetical protein
MRSKGCRYSSMTRLRSEVIAAESAGSPPTDPIDSQARVVMFSGAWSIRSAWAVRSAMSWSRTDPLVAETFDGACQMVCVS